MVTVDYCEENEMKITKMVVSAMMTVGVSLSMVACSGDVDDVSDDVSTTQSEVADDASEGTDDLVTDTGEDVDESDEVEGEEVPDPPKEIIGYAEGVDQVLRDYPIPESYLQGMLDGSVKSEVEIIEVPEGYNFIYESGDVVMFTTPEGLVRDLSPHNYAFNGRDFDPKGIDYYSDGEDVSLIPR